jgi:glutathione S-transferase
MPNVLYTMPYSAWSERARFALLHHGYAFEEREHIPVLGELALRVRARKFSGPATVPLLIEDGLAIMDSLAIAEHVDRKGSGSSLFPDAQREAIEAFNARLEPMFRVARARALQVSMSDGEAARDLVPAALRALPFAEFSGRLGVRFVSWKHPTPKGEIRELLRAGLVEVRTALNGRRYIHGAFSYADIIAATAVQQVAPPEDRYIPLSPIKRRTWADPQLAAEFSDLVSWRDALYAKHRPLKQA